MAIIRRSQELRRDETSFIVKLIEVDFEKGSEGMNLSEGFSEVKIVMEYADKKSLDKFMIEWKKVKDHE